MTAFKIMSDLHLEFQNGQEHDFIVPCDGEDALILAGNIQCGMVMEDWFCELLKHRPVFYIMGNHEYYHHDLAHLKRDFRDFEGKVNQMAKERGYRFLLCCLQDKAVDFKGVTIFGTTLWTDFNFDPRAVVLAQFTMNDYELITNNGDKLRTLHTIDEHQFSLDSLKSYLERNAGDKCIVISHHAPSWQSVNEQHRSDLLNAAYVNRLDELVEQVTLWVHGHTHYSFDYQIGDGRVVCNPRGYYPQDLNKNFNPHLVVNV